MNESLNTPPPAGTHFNVLFTGYAIWLMVPLGAALVYGIFRLYQRETAPFEKAGLWIRRLRAAVIVLLVLLLSQPVVQRVSATFQPPMVIVLRDASDSMRVNDKHEPLERRVRATVALGLLNDKLRDTHAEQAAQSLVSAQDSAEAASAGIRQAIQMLQESPNNSSAAGERVRDACPSLAAVTSQTQQAQKMLSGIANAPAALAAGLKQSIETVQRLNTELSDIAMDSSAAARLLDKTRSVKALSGQLTKLISDLRILQDHSDRTLGEKGGPEVKAALDKLNGMDRAAIIKTMLEKRAIPAAKDRIQVITYDFDTDIKGLSDGTAEEGSTENKATKKTDKKAPPADTDLGTPLLHLAEHHAQQSVAAVIVCSDGRHTTGPTPEDAARALAARGIAVHTLGVGSPDAPPDIAVAKLDGTLSVFLDETIHLTAHIKVAGYTGKKCTLALKREDKVLQQRELQIAGDGWLHENFELPADKSGPNMFTAAITPLPGEALTTNNSAEAVVDVANDRLRVLLVDQEPRWETRYLGSLLRRDRKMTLDERWLLTGDKLGLKPKALPDEQKALDDYDIIVLGDLPVSRLDEQSQKRLASYVADRGGFLVIVAGPEAMPRSYLSGPIAELLPIKLQAASAAAVTSNDASVRARVKLDPAGSNLDITHIFRDPTLNEQLWTALPELRWIARPAYTKPGATPLLVTDDARKDVVAAVHNFGAGRVLYLGSDSTWRWRYKVADRVHAFFWSQAMRWGTSNRLYGDSRLKVGTDRRQIRPGENIEVLARPRDSEGKSVTDAVVIAELDDKERPQRIQLQSIPDSGGLYRGYMQNLNAGTQTIHIKVESTGFEGVKQDVQVVVHEISGQEGVELTRDTARLAGMAKAGGGRYLDILEAPELFEKLAGQGKYVPQESSYELWSSYPALLLVVGCLTAEWLLRKKKGLA